MIESGLFPATLWHSRAESLVLFANLQSTGLGGPTFLAYSSPTGITTLRPGMRTRGDQLHECRCDDAAVERYLARISGPLLDRIDIHLVVPAVGYADLIAGPAGEASAVVRQRVEAARARQRTRFRALSAARANARTPNAVHAPP